MWMAVLDAAGLVALGSHTALALSGFRGFGREAEEIHLIISRGARTAPLAGVRVHESRRLAPAGASWSTVCRARRGSLGDRRCGVAALSAFCLRDVAAVVQQGWPASESSRTVALVGRVRHKAYLRLAVRDIADGAQSLGELDLAAVCRRFGIALPCGRCAAGQRRSLAVSRREWASPPGDRRAGGGRRPPPDVEHWQADMRRERQFVVVAAACCGRPRSSYASIPPTSSPTSAPSACPAPSPSCQVLSAL